MANNRTERIQAEADALRLVEKMVQESGNADGFDAKVWLKLWLSSPLPALNAATPRSCMGTKEGRKLVIGLLQKMQSGAYT